MSESMPNRSEAESKEARKAKLIALAEELSNSNERFPFPGLNPESYAELKKVEEEFPGYATPIDELIERFRQEGFKVAFGNDKESGNVFIVPGNSSDIENDSVLPRHLNDASTEISEKVRGLILANKK